MNNLTELITLDILDFKMNQLNDCYTYSNGVDLFQLKPHGNDIAIYIKVKDCFQFDESGFLNRCTPFLQFFVHFLLSIC